MTISTEQSFISYQGNGSTTQFSIPFPLTEPSDITALLTDPTGVLTLLSPALYTVTLSAPIDPNPTSQGGTLLYPLSGSPLPVGWYITIARIIPFVQDTSLSNQSIIYPPVVEAALDYITMGGQETRRDAKRAITVAPTDPDPAPLPTVANRANKQAFFDSAGNLTAGSAPAGQVPPISAAMAPVVSAATIKDAQIAFGLGQNGYSAIDGSKTSINGTYTLVNADKRKTMFAVNDTFYIISTSAASNYDMDFQVLLVNGSNRGKIINVVGYLAFMLWPGQWCWISNAFQVSWLVTLPPRWAPLGAGPHYMYVDYALGNDGNDGLASGAGALQTLQAACNMVQNFVSGNFVIVLAAGVHNVGNGVTVNQQVQGNDGFTIIGDTATPSNVILEANAGGIVLTAADNAVVSLVGVQIRAISGDLTAGLYATRGAVIGIANINFGSVGTGSHVICSHNATVNINGPYHILSGATFKYHMHMFSAGAIFYNPGTVTIDGPVTIGAGGNFLLGLFSSSIYSATAPTFVNPGFVTGSQYAFGYNATGTLAGAVVPGTIAGTTSLGGIFA